MQISVTVNFDLGKLRISSIEFEKSSVHQVENGIWYTSFIVNGESAYDSVDQVQLAFDDFMNTRMIAEKLYTQVTTISTFS